MKISNSYPYPVLHPDNDDYKDSYFKCAITTTQVFGELKIHSNFDLLNPGIGDLIASGDVVYMLHVQCPQTSYRKAFTTVDSELSISIEQNRLRGKVEIYSFIISQREILDYFNPLLNDWYKSLEINFEKGNFLAIGNAIEVILKEENTDLMNLPAIVDIQRAINKEFMEVEILSQNIIVSLPADEYDLYASYGNTLFKNTIISMVIMPSLVDVFSRIQENRIDLEEYTWYQVMEKLFEENNYCIEDIGTERLSSLKAAQLVLRKPLRSSFKEIEKVSALEE